MNAWESLFALIEDGALLNKIGLMRQRHLINWPLVIKIWREQLAQQTACAVYQSRIVFWTTIYPLPEALPTMNYEFKENFQGGVADYT